MMYYDRSVPTDSLMLQALMHDGHLRPLVAWVHTGMGADVNARIEYRKNKGDYRLGAAQIYIGRYGIVTLVSRGQSQVSVHCDPELTTPAFERFPRPCPLLTAPVDLIIEHLEYHAGRTLAEQHAPDAVLDEGAVHAAFMRRYGVGFESTDRLLAVDSEIQIGFSGTGGKTGTALRNEFESDMIDRFALQRPIPRKLDALGVDPDGSIQVIELKGPRGDLGRAMLQALVHRERFSRLFEQSNDTVSPIRALMAQKQMTGLLDHVRSIQDRPAIKAVIAMPDEGAGWVERWLNRTRGARGLLGKATLGMEFWRLNEDGEIQETHVVAVAEPQSWAQCVQNQQIEWKTTELMPVEARVAGHNFGRRGRSKKTYDRFLPEDLAEHNLLPGIRELALKLFADHDIKWWGDLRDDAGRSRPTNHLRSSQIHCVNTLLSLHKTGRLLDAMRDLVPDAVELVMLESNCPVAFEWIGQAPYLERGGGRGRFRTSIDAFMVAKTQGGRRIGVFLEWKLTETYDAEKNLRFSDRGTDRSNTYRPAYDRAGSIFAQRPDIEHFHFDPHDQLLRQALLANEVRLAGEFEVDAMLLVDCVPAQNGPLRAAVPKGLSHLGETIDTVWKTLLPHEPLTFMVFDPLRWMSLCPELNARYGALLGMTLPIADP